MELERQSRSSAASDHLNNGRTSSTWSSDSESRPLPSGAATISSDLQFEPIPEDHDGLVEEVKQLREQLLIASEQSARERHTFAQVGDFHCEL